MFICALVVSFAARALCARAANDTTRAQINNIHSKSHVIPLLSLFLLDINTLNSVMQIVVCKIITLEKLTNKTTHMPLTPFQNIQIIYGYKQARHFLGYVQNWTLIRCMNCRIDITRCPQPSIFTKTQMIIANMRSYINGKKVCLI